jgi:WD40 repeat protein
MPEKNIKGVDYNNIDYPPLTSESLNDKPPGKLKAVDFSGELRLLFETQNKDFQITKAVGSSSIALKSAFEKITEANFSGDGQRVVAINEDKQEIRIWNAATGQTILSVNNPFFSFGKAVISPDGESLAIAGRDGVVRIYPTTPDGFFKVASEYFAILTN